MEAKRITINQAKKVLENINTYVHVGKFETGLRTNLKRVKSKCYTTTYEYNGFLENATKLAIIAEVNIYRVFEVERSETCYYLKNDYNVGLLNINLMKPENFALVIEGRTVHTLPNKFETFCDYLKKFML